MKKEMTPKERVMAVINQKEFDCLPVISTSSAVNPTCMERANASFPSAHYDPAKMAALAETGYTLLGFDCIMPYFSAHLEASALGCSVQWGDTSNVPVVTEHAITRLGEFAIPSSYPNRAPCSALIKAIRLLKKKHGDTVPIIGKVIGPWGLLYQLYGGDNLTMDLILEPKQIKALFRQLTESAVLFAKAQFDAGADTVTWIDHTIMDFFSPQIYQEFLLPLHQYAARQLAPYGPVIWSIYGNVYDRFELIAQSGFPILHILANNNLQKARETIGNRMLVIGSINNPAVLVSGTPEDVRREVFRCIEYGGRLIAPEAAIPLKTPTANLIELVQSVHRARF